MIRPDQDPTTDFDWNEVKQRLDRAQQSLESAEHLTPEQIKVLMDQRSRQLARVPDEAIDTSELVEVVRFEIGNESLAIETQFVVEQLVRAKGITPIPETDHYFVGVTNLRGDITTVVDLGKFFDIPSNVTPESPLLVLGRSGKPDCAVLVEGLDHVETIRKQEILDPSGGLGTVVDLLIGCTSEAVMILDGEALLNCERLFIDQTEK